MLVNARQETGPNAQVSAQPVWVPPTTDTNTLLFTANPLYTTAGVKNHMTFSFLQFDEIKNFFLKLKSLY